MDDRPLQVNTSQQILDIAQHLVQTRGFNAFSYADIATKLSVTKASLHYHFASKEWLGVRLIERYAAAFAQRLDDIDALGTDAAERLRLYAAIYAGVLADHRMCLCGMLAAEFETLPPRMQDALEEFFASNERWLATLLTQGRIRGELRFTGAPAEAAQYIIASLEGVMMLARPEGGVKRFDCAARRLLSGFGA